MRKERCVRQWARLLVISLEHSESEHLAVDLSWLLLVGLLDCCGFTSLCEADLSRRVASLKVDPADLAKLAEALLNVLACCLLCRSLKAQHARGLVLDALVLLLGSSTLALAVLCRLGRLLLRSLCLLLCTLALVVRLLHLHQKVTVAQRVLLCSALLRLFHRAQLHKRRALELLGRNRSSKPNRENLSGGTVAVRKGAR
jgi:hypothetical protein